MARPPWSRGQPRSPNLIRAPDGAVAIFARGCAIHAQEGWPVEVDDVAMLPNDECGSHGQAGADHVADHHPKPVPARLFGNQQRLSEPATLVELYVDHVEAADKPRNIVEPERAFIGSDRDRAAVPVEVGVLATREGLLEQCHALR